MRRIILIDAMYLVFKSHFAARGLETSDGVPSGALFESLRSVLKLKEDYPDWEIVACWDVHGKKDLWRRKLYPSYKSNRTKDGSALEALDQVRTIKRAFRYIGTPNFGVEGVEADDLISVVTASLFHGYRFRIYTSDHDLYQLLEPGRVEILNKKGTYSAEKFTKEYGVEPKLWPHVKAIAGDASDTYKPVKGLGPKTALRWVKAGARADTFFEYQPDKVQQQLVPSQWEVIRQLGFPLARTIRATDFRGFDQEQQGAIRAAVGELQLGCPTAREGRSLEKFTKLCGSYEMLYLLSRRRRFFK